MNLRLIVLFWEKKKKRVVWFAKSTMTQNDQLFAVISRWVHMVAGISVSNQGLIHQLRS